MASRASWKGYLKVSLVSCPVELYNATTHAKMVSFHLLDKKTHNRIQMKPFDPDLGLVERRDLVHGYEMTKGKYVVVEDEDLENIHLSSTKTIEIEKFVDAAAIDPIYFDSPYFLVPEGSNADEAYRVIREAMQRKGKIGLARLVLSHREHTLAIMPRGKGIMAMMLRQDDELIDEKKIFAAIPAAKPERGMIDIAGKIIDQLSGPFDPKEFTDRYETALRALVKVRAKGKKPVAVEEPKATNVVDLMAALKASLGKREGGPKPAPKPGHKAKIVRLPLRKPTKGKKLGAKRSRRTA